MKIAIVTIQGLGKPNPKYNAKLEKNLRKKFSDPINEATTFFPVDYHSSFQDEQTMLWEKTVQTYKRKIRQRLIRRFLFDYFSDAVTYESDKENSNSVYNRIHSKVYAVLNEAYQSIGNDGILIIVTQSLGGQIISNYIWDLQKSLGGDKKGIWKTTALPDNDFLKFNTFRFWFSTGCNIPMFVSGFEKIEAIEKPNPNFEWYNYFDKSDVLGWPLKMLSKTGENGIINGYNEVVKEDIQINVGLWLLSHIRYWKRKSFYKKAAAKINRLI